MPRIQFACIKFAGVIVGIFVSAFLRGIDLNCSLFCSALSGWEALSLNRARELGGDVFF